MRTLQNTPQYHKKVKWLRLFRRAASSFELHYAFVNMQAKQYVTQEIDLQPFWLSCETQLTIHLHSFFPEAFKKSTYELSQKTIGWLHFKNQFCMTKNEGICKAIMPSEYLVKKNYKILRHLFPLSPDWTNFSADNSCSDECSLNRS